MKPNLDKKDFQLIADDQYLDEKFENSINNLIAKTIYIVNGLKPNNYISLKDWKIIKDNGRIEAITSSITTQMDYDEEKQNYLFLSSSLIKDLAAKHILYDSSERTVFITNVVMNHENSMDLEEQLNYIQNEILNHSVRLERK